MEQLNGKATDKAPQASAELTLSKPQWRIFAARKSRILNLAGQGGGKSASIGFLTGMFVRHFPSVKGFIAANTYLQLTQSTLIQVTKFWSTFFGMVQYHPQTAPHGSYVIDKKPPAGWKKYHELKDYNSTISFKNGHLIFVGSLDNYLAHDGKEFAYAHLDETKDTKEGALKSVILARLREPGIWYNPADDNPITNLQHSKTKPAEGWVEFNPCYIHTSPSEGTVEWLTTMFKLDAWEHDILERIVSETDFFYREDGNRAVCVYSTYHNAKNLPSNYIEDRKNDLTEAQQLKFIYGYPFSKTGGEFYSHFSRITHLGEVDFLFGQPIHVTLDFNVLPYMTFLCAQIYEDAERFQIRFYREYCLPSPLNSTRAVCEAFLTDHQDDITDLFYYGDASGKNRIAGKGDTTNYDDLKEVLEYYLSPGSDRVSRKNKAVLKRREFIERIFAGKVYLDTRKVEIIVDSTCVELAKDLQYLMLGADGKLKELAKDASGASYQKLGHTSDAMEYLVCELLADLM